MGPRALLAPTFALATGCSAGGSAPSSRPTVVARYPADGATGVVINTSVELRFDRDMSAATIVSPANGINALSAGTGVSAVVSYDPPSRTARITPSGPLPPSSAVTVVVGTSVLDTAGLPVAGPIQWSFQTGTSSDTTPPSFSGIAAAVDDSDGTATLSWNAASDDLTPAAMIAYQAYLSTNLATVVASVIGETSLTSPYLPGRSYSFVVRALDAAGNLDGNSVSAPVGITVPEVSFAAQVQPIFTANCALAGCHSGATPTGPGLNLSTGMAYGQIVGVASVEDSADPRIAPFDPLGSYLYRKITPGVGDIVGNLMPRGSATPLADQEISVLRDWILDGAPNN